MITFDTGALIALERKKRRAVEIFQNVLRHGEDVTVPVAVVVEWWRGRTDVRVGILESVVVEGLTPTLAKSAGEALAIVKSATAIDAIVMASAALRGDIVLTSDVGDLEKLRAVFPGVRVLGV